MARLDEIGEQDSWRCWLCDEPVDPEMSVNDPRGPSIDLRTTKAKAKKKGVDGQERLAHRGCNTGKGANAPVVPWPDDLFVIDPAPIIASVERLERKGGREVMARCPTADDADRVAAWLTERVGRLAPGLDATAEVEAGGGQYVVALRR
ncbi:MAG TPA: hypothetical protein VFU14_07200 [Acidimicrobiales bacterium]|nr:hypothetical protein [Acidimicrobiales bacterium]